MNLRRKLQQMENNSNTLVKCPRNECGYVWEYSGEMPMATCPSCQYKCVVSENEVTESNNE